MKAKHNNDYYSTLASESPVEKAQKDIPQGDGDWPGAKYVYRKLKEASIAMSKDPNSYIHCGQEHVQLMAILGCGHEETMKAEMHRLVSRGFILPGYANKTTADSIFKIFDPQEFILLTELRKECMSKGGKFHTHYFPEGNVYWWRFPDNSQIGYNTVDREVLIQN